MSQNDLVLSDSAYVGGALGKFDDGKVHNDSINLSFNVIIVTFNVIFNIFNNVNHPLLWVDGHSQISSDAQWVDTICRQRVHFIQKTSFPRASERANE